VTPQLNSLTQTADRLAQVSGLDTMVGRPSTIWRHQKLRRGLPDLATAVTALGTRLGDDPEPADDEPLFIFAAGWRSGSTLLQRLVVSTGSYFIWGEPYHQTDVIRRLAESLIPFGTGWPPSQYVYESGRPNGDESHNEDLSSQWIANFYPPVDRLVDAHREFLRRLLAPPPEQSERSWGLKEVRLSAEYALYLRLLFPRARFLFLVRDPHAAYRSYRERPTWFERWPRSQVRTPYAYGQVWRRLAESFLDYREALEAPLIRYEDLVAGGEAIDELEALLGAPVDRSVLVDRVGSTSGGDRSGPSALELRMLDRATQPVAARLGYEPAGARTR
jgi:sulfotransferase family protein